MNTTSETGKDPKLGSVLRDDIHQIRITRDFNQEIRELKQFYIDEEKKKRLQQMGMFSRFVHQVLWILKSMFLKLTPFRRLLVAVGLIFLITGSTISFNDQSTSANNNGLIGGVIILFVLMLELKDKLLAKDELEAGRKLQQALLPEQSPSVNGWSLWLFTRSANEVGGDLVDYIKVDENKTGVVIADVAGKGLKAALLMAKLQATVRALSPDYDSLSELGSKVHEIFYRDSLPGLFASMIYAEIVPGTGELKYINAGHLPPLLVKSDGISEMQKGEPALGLMSKFNYIENSLELHSGEIFFAYSDGLSEAQNEYGDFFGIERVKRLLPQLKNYDAARIGQIVVGEVDRFVGNASRFDDLSLVILKKL